MRKISHQKVAAGNPWLEASRHVNARCAGSVRCPWNRRALPATALHVAILKTFGCKTEL